MIEMDPTIVYRLGLSLVVGLIVGFERGWQTRLQRDELSGAGMRSFAIAALFGGLSTLLAERAGSAVLVAAFAALAALTVAGYVLVSRQTQDFGLTTELALLVTFALGALAVQGYEHEALAAAVIVAFVLGLKVEVHRLLERIERQEIAATLQLLLIAAVALPLLPNRGYGPWEVVNPRTIGLLVLLLAGLSWLGYMAVRLLGRQRGVLLTAALGGMTSSTAVTVTMSRMARRDGEIAVPPAAAAIALAAAVMAVRLLIEVALVNSALLAELAAPLAVLGGVPLLAAIWLARAGSPTTSSAQMVSLRNPLELRAALGYAALLTLFLVLLRAADTGLGVRGVYAIAALSGLADVDAAGISLAQAATGSMASSVATTGIILAAMVNTVLKGGLAAVLGGRALARYCLPVLLSAAALSLAVRLALIGLAAR
jgi:uncharacterized membrane protein (DUF4010 family)